MSEAHEDSTTLTNARGEQITITAAEALAMLEPHGVDDETAARFARFDEGCTGWTVHGIKPSD